MKIIFGADISFENTENFEKTFVEKAMGDVRKRFAEADFSVINLENIFGNKEEYEPIPKSGPNLISVPESIEYITVMNPTVVGFANNHAMDYGKGPLLATMQHLKEQGYLCIGAGENIAEAYAPAVLSKAGETAAVIAVCENEFGGATENRVGSAGYSLGRVTKAIKNAREKGQCPIIYFHGGNETNPIPSPKKNELYRHFIDLGAVAVIAMHTHCPQGYEYYNECPIIYSMGNFFFVYPESSEAKSWFYGYMTELEIEDGKTEMTLVPYRFDKMGVHILDGKEKAKMLAYLDCISRPIQSRQKLAVLFDAWCVGSVYIKRLEENFGNVYEKTPAEVATYKNLLNCEAHHELLANVLEMIYDGDRLEKARVLQPIYEKLQNMELVEL